MIYLATVIFTSTLTWTVYAFWFPKETHKDLITGSQQYVLDAAKYNIEVDLDSLRYLGPADLPDSLAGFGLPPHVLLREEYLSDKALLYHELTHALLGCLGHVDNDRPSIMNEYQEHLHLTWKEAVKQLFTEDIIIMNCNPKEISND